MGELAWRYCRERQVRQEVRPATVVKCRSVLGTFVDVVGHDLPASRLRPRHVEKWLERRMEPATRGTHLSILRCWCRWMMRKRFIRVDPTMDFQSPRRPQYLPRGLRLDQVQAILDACGDARMALVVLLMCQEGLRCCEVATVEVGDFDSEQRSLFVRHGKGGKQRVVAVSDETWDVMEAYLRQRGRGAGTLVRSENGHALTANHVSAMVGRLMHGIGIAESAHALRHTAGTDMLRKGAHILDVSRALGHSSMAVTQRYLPWLVGDLRDAMGGRRYQPDVSAAPAEAAGRDDAA